VAIHLKELVMRHCFVFAILLGGCIPGFGDADSTVEGEEGEEEEDGDIDRDDCKIEGEKIGQEGVVLALGSRSVTFSGWVGKADSPGEYVGFTISVTNDSAVSYVVKAGGERHPSSATTWLHPAGADGGADAPGISNVDMCDGDGGGGDGGGGDDGGGDDGPIL
jgi:hypothetical protein